VRPRPTTAPTLPTERQRQCSLTGYERQDSLTLVSELPDLSLNSTADAAGSADPAVGLRLVRALQRLQERLEAIHVTNAREQGWSWQAIANALGVSRQAVHQKYNRRR
jgi:CRP-like cAMP-binding protein